MSRGRHTAYVAASIMKDAPAAFQTGIRTEKTRPAAAEATVPCSDMDRGCRHSR